MLAEVGRIVLDEKLVLDMGPTDAFRSRPDRRQGIEVAIAVHVLNRMLELSRPESGSVA